MQTVSTKNLTKVYKAKTFSGNEVTALSKVNFSVESGEIFGLLGPNGAGKTTLIKILLGIVHPTDGEVKVFDKDISDASYKKRIGYLPENHKFPLYLTGDQVLYYYGRLAGLDNDTIKKRSDEYLKIVEMDNWRKTKVKSYSKGMMQRLGLAQAMLNEPDIIFLDEPTDGVDPIGRKEIRDVLLNLKSKGKTIFLNSHLLSEIEMICDRVAILKKGELVRIGRVDEITSGTDVYRIAVSELSQDMINKLITEHRAEVSGKQEFMFHAPDLSALNSIIDYLRTNGVMISEVHKQKDSLEDTFINIIEKQN